MTTNPAPQSRESLDGKIYVELTHSHLDIPTAIARVKSPKAGAVVMFAGTTHASSHVKDRHEGAAVNTRALVHTCVFF